jgi:hypothetical protein
MNMKTVAGSTSMRRPRPDTNAFALAEVVIGMALVVLVLAMLFAMNGQLLGLLRQGKQSTYATELIAERVEQLRTATWEAVTVPANLEGVLKLGKTATESNLPGVTETFKMEPYDNPTGLGFQCVRTPAGVQTPTGSAFTANLVKVSIAVKWKSGKRDRERQFVTVMSQFRG